MGAQVYAGAGLEQSVAKAEQYVWRHAFHLQRHEQGGNLLVGVFLFCDAEHHLFDFIARGCLAGNDSLE
jgi:hypothetical protein